MIRSQDLIVITPDQKRDGYLLKVGDTIISLPYTNVGPQLSNGNWLATHSHRIVT